MEKLPLAMLAQWAESTQSGRIHGRKRLQKVIYFLQQAGCPIDSEYSLHHYGPYSREIAQTTDVMVAERLLIEEREDSGQFVYKLGTETGRMIEQTRASQPEEVRALEAFKDKAIELLGLDIWQLELGSTILYFKKANHPSGDWDSAITEACNYKKTNPNDPKSQAALLLAKQFASVNA